MFHVPFDVLGAIIYGTELVMWIGIMICGLVLGRGEKEAQEENVELPQVSALVTSPSIRTQHSGEYCIQGSADTDQADTPSIRSRQSRHSVFYTSSLRSEMES